MVELKEMERLLGTEAELQERVAGLNKEIETLEYYGASRSIMICSHNTILAIKMFGGITHVVDTKEDSNLKMIGRVDAHLSVQRYEPKTAKAWMKEDVGFGNSCGDDYERTAPEKVLLSERELREIVLADKRGTVEVLDRSIEAYKNLKVA